MFEMILCALDSIPPRIAAAGLHRRVAVIVLAMITAIVSAVLAVSSQQGELEVASEILFISLIGFSAIAAVSWNCVRGWRAIDYIWVSATFVTAVVALVKISEGSRLETLSRAQTNMRAAFADFLYSTESVLVNDCQDLSTRRGMWQREFPGQDACDRIAHFLPQMRRDFDNPDTGSGNLWGSEFHVPGPAGRLAETGDKFDRLYAEYLRTKNANLQPTGVKAFLAGSRVKIWYYVLAFLVGLRLSKVTAELIQTAAATRRSA